MSQNKKRKQSQIYSDQQHQYDQDDGKMVDDHEIIESVLFEGMTEVNSKLISLGNTFKLVDNLYFVGNSGMVDEFIGNMQQFMKQLENQRTKVAFGKLNSDILNHVYQFLDTTNLVHCCGLVCKLWRESLIGLKFTIKSHNWPNFSCSSLINHVTELRLFYFNLTSFMSLSNCTNLNQLAVLDLVLTDLNTECIKQLLKCKMPNLTELKFSLVAIDENCAIELFNSNFMSSIKKLDLNAIENVTNNFYESVSESKYLNQITHLTNSFSNPQIGKRIDLLLKDKINLEHLHVHNYEFSLSSNLLINGNYKNLKYLNISYCQIKNQEFANLLVSPNLPNLETVIANDLCFNWIVEIDNVVAVFPPNSQSSITELELRDFNPELYPSLFDHCPKLKILDIRPLLNNENSEIVFENMMKSPSLSNLELLDIVYDDIVEDIFINPIYSNLTVLNIDGIYNNIDKVKSLSNCANLVNLTILNLSGADVKRSLIEEISRVIHNNPTFEKLKHITLPTERDSSYENDCAD